MYAPELQPLYRDVDELQTPLQVSSATLILDVVQAIADTALLQFANAVHGGLPGKLAAIIAKRYGHDVAQRMAVGCGKGQSGSTRIEQRAVLLVAESGNEVQPQQ